MSNPRTAARLARVLMVVFSWVLATEAAPAQPTAVQPSSLTIDTVVAHGSETLAVDILLDNPNHAVECFALSVAYDASILTITDVSIAGTVTEAQGAEMVVPEIFAAEGGFTLRVVMDQTPPYAGQTIPPGNNQRIATFSARADRVPAPNPGDPNLVVELVFVDRVFSAPALVNTLVVGGDPLEAPGNLGLNNGRFVVQSAAIDAFTIESAVIDAGAAPAGAGATATARVFMTNLSPAQGVVMAITHDPEIVELVDFNVEDTVTEALGAEFVFSNIRPEGGPGGTLGVVMDFNPPFEGDTLPPGTDQHIANLVYECRTLATCGLQGPPPAAKSSVLAFVDGVLGLPPLDNVIVANGLSASPELNHGTITCTPVDLAPGDTEFWCGAEDPESGQIADPEGVAGQTVPLCFFYTEGFDPDPNDGFPDCTGSGLQAFQLSIRYDCNLVVSPDSFTVEGTILEAVGAEFVNANVEADPDALDGTCNMTIGILLDALPPFTAQTAPPSCNPLLIGCVEARIDEAASCGSSLAVEFVNGMDGGAGIPLNNIVVIDNESWGCFETHDCAVSVVPAPLFTRGDCNDDDIVDLADAQSMLAMQFQGFPAPCLDACDATDDGTVDLGDAVLIVNYLFDLGAPPKDPGPDPLEPGPDPTADTLDCAARAECD